MIITISSLIRGMDEMEEVARAIDAQKDPELGVELIAFTHDPDYWDRLVKLTEELSCPISFHGPYVQVEATSEPGSPESDWLLESYRRVIDLSDACDALHIVFHYSQLQFTRESVEAARRNSLWHLNRLMELQKGKKADILVENLAFQKGKVPLFTNKQFFDLFATHPDLRALIDLGHANVNKLDVPEFLRRFGSRVGGYHLHNNDGARDLHNRICDGTFDYAEFAKDYKKYTPETTLVLEYEPHVNMTYAELFREADRLRELYD